MLVLVGGVIDPGQWRLLEPIKFIHLKQPEQQPRPLSDKWWQMMTNGVSVDPGGLLLGWSLVAQAFQLQIELVCRPGVVHLPSFASPPREGDPQTGKVPPTLESNTTGGGECWSSQLGQAVV